MANPLTAIEQITYLVFLKQLEDLDNKRKTEADKHRISYRSIFIDFEKCRWSQIKRMPSEERLHQIKNEVFKWMKDIARNSGYEQMGDAIFLISSSNLLDTAINVIDNLFIPSQNQDTLGDIYEYLLSEIAEAGKNGQFRTPRHMIRLMIELIDPQFGERIADPACGTGGFLVNAHQHILKEKTSIELLLFDAEGTPINATGDLLTKEQRNALGKSLIYGWDFDRTMVRLSWMNLIQHGLKEPNIDYADTLGSHFNDKLTANGGSVGNFDIVLANPPFTGNIYKEDIGQSLQWLGANKTELLFLELIIQLLRVGGRAGVIVPDGGLFGSTRAHIALRKKLVNENTINAIISLPGGIFQPYSGVKTSITKGGMTKRIWFYEINADGFSLDSKRNINYEENNLWDLIIKYRLVFHHPCPKFIAQDVWEEWESLNEEDINRSYFKPSFRTKLTKNDDCEEAMVLLDKVMVESNFFKGNLSNIWTASLSDLESSEWNLSASRYKPYFSSDKKYKPPIKIINEIKTLEQQIQNDLDALLAALENNEQQ
jgi:type I restriction enzyme M protein